MKIKVSRAEKCNTTKQHKYDALRAVFSMEEGKEGNEYRKAKFDTLIKNLLWRRRS
jgi:hypothetical protein